MPVKLWLSLSVVCLFVTGAPTQSAAQTQVGSAIKVENTVEGSQGGTVRILSVRSGVNQNETISTKAASAASLRFRDKTTMSMGANSQVTLDRFVYNPSRKTSDIVFNATRGAFRFVTGVAASSNYRFVTPTATVGVRGTEFDIYVNKIGDTMVLGRKGQVIACPRTETDVSPGNQFCCNITLSGSPRYGIIMRNDFQCEGPHIWRGQNPGTLLSDARHGGKSGGDDDRSNSPSKSDQPKRVDAPSPKIDAGEYEPQ